MAFNQGANGGKDLAPQLGWIKVFDAFGVAVIQMQIEHCGQKRGHGSALTGKQSFNPLLDLGDLDRVDHIRL